MKNNKSAWKAEIEIDEVKPQRFPHGMVGFPEAKEYVVINSGGGDIVCFQSTEQLEASFLMTPWDEARLGPVPSLTPDQKAALEYSDTHNVLWLLVLNPFADREWVLANLQAPVALNQDAGLGMQCIQADSRLELRYHWMPQPSQVEKKAA
jgi:flagellar assembly factor FliW